MNNDIGDEGAKGLAKSLKKNSSLYKIDLGNIFIHIDKNKITTVGILKFAEFLNYNDSIYIINLSNTLSYTIDSNPYTMDTVSHLNDPRLSLN